MARHPLTEAFVGRSAELATLAALHAGTERRASLVLLEGEAGAGKSRLVEEFLARAVDIELQLRSFCYPSSDTGPYFPFLQILNDLQVSGRLPPEWHHAGLTSADWRSLSGDARGQRSRFLKGVSGAILEATHGANTILVVEDVHWADVGSLLLLNALLDAGTPGPFVICTARSDERPAPEGLQLLARLRQGSAQVELRGLSEEEVQELVAALAGPGLLAPNEVHDLRDLTNGNPLFVRELVLHLEETGQLQRQRLLQAVSRSLPSRMLGDLIDARLSHLPATERATLEVAAAVGRVFSAELVARAIREPQTRVTDDLELAARRGFVRTPEAPRMRGDYVFAHPLIQQRLYQSLLPGRRRQLHRQVARAATSGTGTTNGELARHYALGFGRRAERKAVQYCSQAAEQSEAVLAYESAARFWELALDCTGAGSLLARAELQWRLGWALWAANNWTQAAEVWSEAASNFESLGASDRVAQLALALGEIFRFRLDLPSAVHWLERALTLLPEPVSQERARALALLGSIRCIDGGAGDGLGLLQQACDALPGGHADPMVGYWLAFGFLVSGEEARGHEVAVQAFEEARRTNSARAITLLAGGLIHNELTHLRPDMAEYYSRILEAAVDATDVAALSQSLLSRALVLGYSGRWQEVLELCEQWMGRVRLAGTFQVATARLIWAEAARALGHPDAAVTEMRRALADLDEMRPLAPLHLARALAAAGDLVEATEIAHASATVVLEGRRFATARVLLGELASRLDEPELWERCLELLSGERRPLVMGYSPISVRRVRGRLAMRLKRWALATTCFEESTQELEQGAAWWELA
ncbi:MAG: AAA family ATPase, partial [Chloroflexi bacterium]|nr:AAA family ATPase [Chloroflexota bacterium]